MKDELKPEGAASQSTDAADGTRPCDARSRWAQRLRQVQGHRERRQRAAESLVRLQRSNRIH